MCFAKQCQKIKTFKRAPCHQSKTTEEMNFINSHVRTPCSLRSWNPLMTPTTTLLPPQSVHRARSHCTTDLGRPELNIKTLVGTFPYWEKAITFSEIYNPNTSVTQRLCFCLHKPSIGVCAPFGRLVSGTSHPVPVFEECTLQEKERNSELDLRELGALTAILWSGLALYSYTGAISRKWLLKFNYYRTLKLQFFSHVSYL